MYFLAIWPWVRYLAFCAGFLIYNTEMVLLSVFLRHGEDQKKASL